MVDVSAIRRIYRAIRNDDKVMAKMVIVFGLLLLHPLLAVCSVIILARIKSDHKSGTVIRNMADEERKENDPTRDPSEMYNDIFSAIKGMGKHMKTHALPPLDRRAYDVSRGTSRMRYFIDYKNMSGSHYNTVAEIGTGRGGFTQALAESITWDRYVCCSRWKQVGQESLFYRHKKIEYASSVAEHMEPFQVDLLISDMGEDYGTYETTTLGTERILSILDPWMKQRPPNFLIRIPNPYGEGVLNILESWKTTLGTGKLVRSPDERNDSTTVYFTDGQGSIRNTLANIQYGQLANIYDYAKTRDDAQEDEEPLKKKIKERGWPKRPTKAPYPILDPANYSAALRREGPLQKPRNTTYFAKEIGYHKGSIIGSEGTARNNIVYNLIEGLVNLMPLFNSWMTTSTLPEVTHKIFLDKVDKAPLEDHDQYDRIWACYQAMSKFCHAKGLTMRPLTDEQILMDVNRNGAMGYQEQHLGKRNLGEYIDDPRLWKTREAEHDAKLLKNQAELIIYNSIGKKEKKQKKGSRLIWFLPATARIHETRWLGSIDHILEQMPFSVGGKPLYDYGELLARDFDEDTVAICDDVAGWDTRVSLGLLSAECEFLLSITPDEEQRKRIKALYRVYSHPMVKTHRNMAGSVEEAIYWLQGQVASGRRVTYSLNTITNFGVTFGRLSYAKGWSVEETERRALDYLLAGQSSYYRGKISGDDSAILMGTEDGITYATKGAKFMNEIGMNRKGVAENDPSPIRYRMEDVDFCSHHFTRITFHGPTGDTSRWMPIRPAADILAKASIMIGNPGNKNSTMAWARAQGLTMLTVYPHIPTVRMVAQALLSATDERVAISDVKLGWTMRNAPWLKPGDAVNIINDCLFGQSTTIKSNHRIADITDVGYIHMRDRIDYDLNFRNWAYRKWKSNLRNVVAKSRQLYNVEYTRDWLSYLE